MTNFADLLMIAVDHDRAPLMKQGLIESKQKIEMDSNKSVQISLTSPDHMYVGKRKEVVRLLFLDLTNCSRVVQFFVCSAGVFIFYLVYGYMQVSAVFCSSFLGA